MALKITHDYDDIIDLARPAPRHPRMEGANRAKIFSPFAALRGYDDAVAAQTVQRTNKIALSEEEQARVNAQLAALTKHQRVTVRHFVRDPGSDGAGGVADGRYQTDTGTIDRLEPAYRFLRLQTEEESIPLKICFGDIVWVQG